MSDERYGVDIADISCSNSKTVGSLKTCTRLR